MVASKNKRMSRMLAPSSIAFIGGSIAAMAIRRALDIGFRGEIWPVNPNLDEVEGYRCYHSLAELPSVPDAAFIGVRRDLTIAAVRTLSEAGAGGCSCYAAGFAEIGDEGLAFQEELIAAANGMPLVGPNSFGIINFVDRSALWPYVFGGTPVDRGVAFISQSGNIAMNLTMNQRSVRFTHIIAAGNQAVLGPGDYVEALLDEVGVATQPQPLFDATNLRGQVAIVTGGSSGIGRAVALELARCGTHIAFCFLDSGAQARLDAQSAARSLREMEVRVLFRSCDVRESPDVKRFVSEVEQEFGGVHILINNAGVAVRGPLTSMPQELMEQGLWVNVIGPVLATQAALPALL
ncbi:MAG: SDR family NAD(P)-dependent oxidoreductase, partial [Proteobacteria bacterium]|nr:SDR family NAD(P)-dependent oxidoreductase [Pseudomonadota bacterium]